MFYESSNISAGFSSIYHLRYNLYALACLVVKADSYTGGSIPMGSLVF